MARVMSVLLCSPVAVSMLPLALLSEGEAELVAVLVCPSSVVSTSSFDFVVVSNGVECAATDVGGRAGGGGGDANVSALGGSADGGGAGVAVGSGVDVAATSVGGRAGGGATAVGGNAGVTVVSDVDVITVGGSGCRRCCCQRHC